MLMTAVTITQAPLEIEDLLAVVDGAPVKLDEATRARIAASRAVVDEALRCEGIVPHVLGDRDGLALMSANVVSVADGPHVVDRAERTARAADLAARLSMQATGANVSIVHQAVGRAKPITGQIAAADHIR